MNLSRNTGRVLSIAALSIAVFTAKPAVAASTVFDLTYSGGEFGNTATATGTIALDLSQINNPGITFSSSNSFVTAFSVTVSGASVGNGTFDLTDYSDAEGGLFVISTADATLDFTQELVGQSTPYGPWSSGRDRGVVGEFNFTSGTTGQTDNAPSANGSFIIQTMNRDGDLLRLTSFAPEVTATPEPSSLASMSIGVIGLSAFIIRARKRRTNSV